MTLKKAKKKTVKKLENGFTQTPNHIIMDKNLSASEKLVLIGLKMHDFKNSNESYPNQETLAEELNLSLSTVKRALVGLVDKGYLAVRKKENEDKWDSNIYTFLYDSSTTKAKKTPKLKKVVKPKEIIERPEVTKVIDLVKDYIGREDLSYPDAESIYKASDENIVLIERGLKNITNPKKIVKTYDYLSTVVTNEKNKEETELKKAMGSNRFSKREYTGSTDISGCSMDIWDY